MLAPQDTAHELADVVVDDVVMRGLARVPELEARGPQCTSREEDHPLGTPEFGRRDLLPGESADLSEHRDTLEPVDRFVLLGRLGEHGGVEQVAPDHEGRIVRKALASAMASLLRLSHPHARLGRLSLASRSQGYASYWRR